MINEHIEYVNKLGKNKILEIMKQNNGLYFMAILYRGEIISFEKNCTKQRVQEFRKKILDNEKILAIKNKQSIIISDGRKNYDKKSISRHQ